MVFVVIGCCAALDVDTFKALADVVDVRKEKSCREDCDGCTASPFDCVNRPLSCAIMASLRDASVRR